MSNLEIYNYFLSHNVPSPIAAQAADMISLQQEELGETSISRIGLIDLLDLFVEMVKLEENTALETLARSII